MKKIKIPVQNVFTAEFDLSSIGKKEIVEAPDGRKMVKLGAIHADNKNPELLHARNNGSEVIWATINIEAKMSDLISKYLFGIGIGYNERLSFFNNEIISSSFITFSFLKSLSVKLVQQVNLLSKKKRSDLENKLKKVMRYRNAFAHGELSINTDNICTLAFYSGERQEFQLIDSFWIELESVFTTANELLDEASKKLSQINMNKVDQDRPNYKL